MCCSLLVARYSSPQIADRRSASLRAALRSESQERKQGNDATHVTRKSPHKDE